MSLKPRQVTFLIVFLFFFLLLLILGESYLRFTLLGAGGLLLLLFHKELEWGRLLIRPWIVVLWLVFSLFLTWSSIFTVSTPLTLSALVFYGFSFVFFWFVYLVRSRFIKKEWFVYGFLLVGVVLIALSLIFALMPAWASLLPGLNLLYATYGHNHLAAYLLLIIPLSWWLAINQKFKKSLKKIVLLLPLVFTLSLLISFGRVAVLIGLLQFMVIFRIWRHHFKSSKLLHTLYLIILFAFILVLSTKLFFSLVTKLKPDFHCPVPQLERQLCKPLDTETRPYYWQQAVGVIKEYPAFGSGPGTFGIAAIKHRLIPGTTSAYAHNAFLQTLAEIGLVGGGVFVLLMFYLLWQAMRVVLEKASGEKSLPLLGKLKKITNSTFGLDKALLIGVISIYVDVLFDWDWSFVGIFSLTLIFLALILRDKGIRQGNSKKLKVKFLSPIFRTSYFAISVFLITIAGLYIVTEFYITSDQSQRAFRFFPYFHWHMRLFEADEALDDQDRDKLLDIYQNHSQIYSFFISDEKDDQKKLELKKKLIELDPWRGQYDSLVDYYLVKKDYDQAGKEAQATFDLYTRANSVRKYEVEYSRLVELANQVLEIADGFYEQEQLEAAGNYYVLAQSLEPWILDKHKPVFIDSEVTLEKQLVFFTQLRVLDSKYLGSNTDFYSLQFSKIIDSILKNNQLASLELKNYGDTTIDLQEQTINWLQDEHVRLFQVLADQSVEDQEWEEAEKYLKVTHGFDNYWGLSQLGHYYLWRGKVELARMSYDDCLQIWQKIISDSKENIDDETHHECVNGLSSIENGWDFSDRYLQTRQIILGEKIWQDFVD